MLRRPVCPNDRPPPPTPLAAEMGYEEAPAPQQFASLFDLRIGDERWDFPGIPAQHEIRLSAVIEALHRVARAHNGVIVTNSSALGLIRHIRITINASVETVKGAQV
jgi:hypothetical protein